MQFYFDFVYNNNTKKNTITARVAFQLPYKDFSFGKLATLGYFAADFYMNKDTSAKCVCMHAFMLYDCQILTIKCFVYIR